MFNIKEGRTMMAVMQLAAAGIVLAATGVASQDADQKIYTDLAGLSSTPS